MLYPQEVYRACCSFLSSVNAKWAVGATACLHTSTFLRLCPSHSADLGRGPAVNLYSYTPKLPNTRQTGLILLFTAQKCCIAVNKQHFSCSADEIWTPVLLFACCINHKTHCHRYNGWIAENFISLTRNIRAVHALVWKYAACYVWQKQSCKFSGIFELLELKSTNFMFI